MKRRMYVYFFFPFFLFLNIILWENFKLSVHGKLLLTFMHVTSSVFAPFLIENGHSHHFYNLSL